MSPQTLFRLSGVALLLCGVFALFGHPLGMFGLGSITITQVDNPLWTPTHTLVLLSNLCGLLGLSGLYARLSGRLGLVALIGYIFFMVRLATSIGSKLYDLISKPVLATVPEARALASVGRLSSLYGEWGIVLSLVLAMGTLLFGIAILRSGYQARWAGLLIVIGSVLFFLTPLNLVIRDSGLAWLGIALLLEQRVHRTTTESAGTPPAVV